jgi:hypothetical protein
MESHLLRCGESEVDSATLADVIIDAAYTLSRLNCDGSGRSPADYVTDWTRKGTEGRATT